MEKMEETFVQNLDIMTGFVDRIENDLTQLKAFINLQKIKYTSRRESQEDENDFLKIEAYYSMNRHRHLENPSTSTSNSNAQKYPYNQDFTIYNAADEDNEEVDDGDDNDDDPVEPNYLDETDHDHDYDIDVKPQMSNYYSPSVHSRQSRNLNHQRQLCDSLNASISPKRTRSSTAVGYKKQPKYVYKKVGKKLDIKKAQERKGTMEIICPEPGCYYRTFAYFDMRTHFINLHPFSNHPSYPVWRCEICNFFGMFKTALIDHMKKKHKQIPGFREKLKDLTLKTGTHISPMVTIPPVKKRKVNPQLDSIDSTSKIKSNPNLEQNGGESVFLIHNPKYPSLSMTRTLRGGFGRPNKKHLVDSWTKPSLWAQRNGEGEGTENLKVSTNLSLNVNTNNTNSNENIEAETEQSNNEEQNTMIGENESTNDIEISRNIPPDPLAMD